MNKYNTTAREQVYVINGCIVAASAVRDYDRK